MAKPVPLSPAELSSSVPSAEPAQVPIQVSPAHRFSRISVQLRIPPQRLGHALVLIKSHRWQEHLCYLFLENNHVRAPAL